jgi:hypothetical protein
MTDPYSLEVVRAMKEKQFHIMEKFMVENNHPHLPAWWLRFHGQLAVYRNELDQLKWALAHTPDQQAFWAYDLLHSAYTKCPEIIRLLVSYSDGTWTGWLRQGIGSTFTFECLQILQNAGIYPESIYEYWDIVKDEFEYDRPVLAWIQRTCKDHMEALRATASPQTKRLLTLTLNHMYELRWQARKAWVFAVIAETAPPTFFGLRTSRRCHSHLKTEEE